MRRRLASSTVALLAAAIAAVALGDGARAQAPPGPLAPTPIEAEALELYRQNKLITARAKAEAALAADPDSPIAHFVLAEVLREAEGALARAMFHLGRARELLEARFGAQPPVGAPADLHRHVLFATQLLAGEMEEYEFQIQILDYYDALYDPDLLAERAWAVLRLGRYDEARSYAHRAIASGDDWQRTLGKNALCAIEAEAKQRQAQFDACMDALADARKNAEVALEAASRLPDANAPTDPNAPKDPNAPADANAPKTAGPSLTSTSLAVHAYNAAEAAYSILRHDEVEKLAREGTQRRERTVANPWRLLTRFYLDGGRIAESVSAAGEMQAWRARLPASLRDQDRAETDVALATLFLVAGEPEPGLRLVDRAIERPDRRGLVSSNAEQALGASALLRRALARAYAERVAERASVSGTVARVKAAGTEALARAGVLPDEQRIANVLTDDRRLDATFRIYLSGGIEPVPVWLLGDLVDVLGTGVVSVVLRRVRAEEAALPQLTAYYDALEAEVALRRGEPQRAVDLAKRALEALPHGEVLLEARTAAVGGEAARREGDLAAAVGLFERALQKDAGTIRRLGWALPASIEAPGGDPILARAAELLRRSPRLRVEPGGFVVRLERAGASARACLASRQGATLACADAARADKEASDDFAARIVDEFHRIAFSPRMGGASVDLRSLDGSTTVADQAQREQVQKVLRDLGEP